MRQGHPGMIATPCRVVLGHWLLTILPAVHDTDSAFSGTRITVKSHDFFSIFVFYFPRSGSTRLRRRGFRFDENSNGMLLAIHVVLRRIRTKFQNGFFDGFPIVETNRVFLVFQLFATTARILTEIFHPVETIFCRDVRWKPDERIIGN